MSEKKKVLFDKNIFMAATIVINITVACWRRVVCIVYFQVIVYHFEESSFTIPLLAIVHEW